MSFKEEWSHRNCLAVEAIFVRAKGVYGNVSISSILLLTYSKKNVNIALITIYQWAGRPFKCTCTLSAQVILVLP